MIQPRDCGTRDRPSEGVPALLAGGSGLGVAIGWTLLVLVHAGSDAAFGNLVVATLAAGFVIGAVLSVGCGLTRRVMRFGARRRAADLLKAALVGPRESVTVTVTEPADGVERGRPESPDAGTSRGKTGSGGRIRTYDQAVNSRPLYH